MTSVHSAAQTALQLADWRARVSALYDAVRAEIDPGAGHRIWRQGRTELFATHPQSPIAGNEELLATGVGYWPYDPAFRFTLEVLAAEPEGRVVDTGDDGTVTLRRIGRVELPDPVGASLDVWTLGQYGAGLFVPLRDGTSGETSYGGGRYLLDTAKGAWLGGDDRSIVLDLNFGYHPSCRYDARWTCPLAPPGNTVTARVEAGERL
ncbi:MAG: DUF1684 domain-containing protein [Marmoricola sp.]